MTGYNMPPGCNECDIPGNSEDDALCEDICNKCDVLECPFMDMDDCPQIKARHEGYNES